MRDTFKARPMSCVKTLSDADQPGTFEALVSVFNNVDSDGETVMPGAFTKTLADGPKPLVYSHDWVSVPIGQTISAVETPEGLLVKGRLFVGPDEDHARAREVYAAMRGGALTEFSFGGKVTRETLIKNDDGSETVQLNEIDLVEYGPCLKGANPATRLLAVKSMVQAEVMTREEARKVLHLDPNLVPFPPVKKADPKPDETAPLGDDSDTDGNAVDTDGPTTVSADDGWSATLAAVRAGVLTVPEARDRLGLQTAAPAPAESADDGAAGDAHAAAVAALELA